VLPIPMRSVARYYSRISLSIEDQPFADDRPDPRRSAPTRRPIAVRHKKRQKRKPDALGFQAAIAALLANGKNSQRYYLCTNVVARAIPRRIDSIGRLVFDSAWNRSARLEWVPRNARQLVALKPANGHTRTLARSAISRPLPPPRRCAAHRQVSGCQPGPAQMRSRSVERARDRAIRRVAAESPDSKAFRAFRCQP